MRETNTTTTTSTATSRASEAEALPAVDGGGLAWRPAGRQLGAALPVAVLLLLYGLVQARYFTPAVCETDTAGYVMMAERLAAGQPVGQPEADIFLFQSHVWVENQQGEVIAKYSPGLPLLMALGYRLGGETGLFLVSPVAGGLALLGAFLLFRLWMSGPAAWFGMLALAANPMLLAYSNYPLAHAVDLAAVTWGMFFLWRWLRNPQLGSAIGAGLALGFAPLVRPTSALLALAVAWVVVVASWRRWRSDRQMPCGPVVILLLAYAVWPTWLACYNWRWFGSPLITGYALSNEQTAFAATGLAAGIARALHGLGGDGLALLFGIGVLGLLTFRGWAERLLAWLWFLPTLLLYSAYYYNQPGNGMAFSRFLIVLFPVLVGAGFALLDRLPARTVPTEGGGDQTGEPLAGGWRSFGRRLGRSTRRHAVAAGVAMLLLGLRWVEAESLLRGVAAGPSPSWQLSAARQAAILPPGSVVIAATQAAYHLGPGRDFILYERDAFRPGGPHHLRQQRPGTPRQQESRRQRLLEFYQNNNAAETTNQLLRECVRRHRQAGRTVAFIVPTHEQRQIQASLGSDFSLHTLAEWDLSTALRFAFDYVRGLPRGGAWNWSIYEVRELTPAPSD